MSKKVFISYRHHQADWVRDRLVPCLRYGGAEVMVDYEKFAAGRTVPGEMNNYQDAADVSVLVLTQAYLDSDYCRHEMERALQHNQPIVPIVREDCSHPESINQLIQVDLRDDGAAAQWDKVLKQCGADLGTDAPIWLAARDELLTFLPRGQSVNLHIKGRPQYAAEPNWRALLKHLIKDHQLELCKVDLDKGTTASRRGLIVEILKELGSTIPVPEPPEDLSVLHQTLSVGRLTRLALLHFDNVKKRYVLDRYDDDLFNALRYLIMDVRKLVLLAISRQEFAALVPDNNELSKIDIKTVELRGRHVYDSHSS